MLRADKSVYTANLFLNQNRRAPAVTQASWGFELVDSTRPMNIITAKGLRNKMALMP